MMSNKDNNGNASNGSSNNNRKRDTSFMEQVNKNLNKNDDQKRSENKFFKVLSGQKCNIQLTDVFGPERRTIKDPKTGEDKVINQYVYKIIDLDHPKDGFKTWSVSRTVSDDLDHWLREEVTALEVERKGAGMSDTKYYFRPLPDNRKVNIDDIADNDGTPAS